MGAPHPAAGQQQVDTAFHATLRAATWPLRTGPVVLLDEAHQNFHTLGGRYRPFADLLEQDGFVVRPLQGSLRQAVLSGARVLVIANALHPSNVGRWQLPTPSAFTAEEISAVRAWVEDGGALLLIADHMPFPGAAGSLAAAFGFQFSNGFAVDTLADPTAPMLFRRATRTLQDHPVTMGRIPEERVDSVATFTGQAFTADGDVQPLLVLGPHTMSLLPEVAWQFDARTRRAAATGWLQGAVRHVGRGRVAVFGEAAMFSAQRQGPEGLPMGMNSPLAGQNPQFLLNVMHWLTALIAPDA